MLHRYSSIFTLILAKRPRSIFIVIKIHLFVLGLITLLLTLKAVKYYRIVVLLEKFKKTYVLMSYANEISGK